MTCLLCKHGQTAPGAATMTFDHAGTVVVIRNVPADVCQTCHEPYFNGEITDRLLSLAKDAARSGVQVEIREYLAA